ncbi:MAG: TRAM domain-containing protein [Proteobacteria bacterium]|nr:TRAM domain-containing protein [Pseudomonadota bacterium]MDA1357947.1 TRAM domain-containing protein [Pseudomonadota bacterium]
MQCELTIEALGTGGDGVAWHDGVKLFVPGALPGERVRVELEQAAPGATRARLLERLTDSHYRATPACEYFGDCGGCVAQHMAAKPYGDWKIDVIRDALAHRGLTEVAIAPLITSPPASRRRVRFAVTRRHGAPEGGVALGFRRRGSDEIIAIERCAVLLPALEALLQPLRGLAAKLGMAEISLTQAHQGTDAILHGLDAPPALRMREMLAAFADSHGIQRLSVESPPADRGGKGAAGRSAGKRKRRQGAQVLETIAQSSVVRVCFAGAWVDFPHGAFLQPTAAGEAAIQRLVRDGLGLAELTAGKRAVQIADLYAGLGGIGFALATSGGAAAPRCQVAMFEGDAAMVGAARTAAGQADLMVTAEERDLARRPLSVAELKAYDAVIFDPPRAGAREQAEALAASGVARIAAVSCNAASFARDARILIDGGYRMQMLTPIDQFLWSSHVELVAIFERE